MFVFVIIILFRPTKVSSFIALGILVMEIYKSLWTATVVLAIRQELELYTEIDQGGDAILIRNKIPNLKELSPTIASNIKSFCVRGRWRMYPKADFSFDNIADLQAFNAKEFKCHNLGLGKLNLTGSARYLGSSDNDVESISFYSEEHQLGSEVVVEADELSDIPFVPHSLIAMGQSSWTVWTEKNFKGQSTCYKSAKIVAALNSLENAIGSVMRECNEQTNNTEILNDTKASPSIIDLIEAAVKARSAKKVV